MAYHSNRVKVSTATTSTGTITLGSAVSAAFYSFAECVPAYADGQQISYTIVEGTNVEQGKGTLGGSLTTLTRDTVEVAKIGGVVYTDGTKIDLQGTATVFETPSAKDLMFRDTHGADIASASTVNLETATGALIDVTGTTTITAITLNDGHQRTVRFTGVLTLTNGANLVLPGGANITTASGDFAIFQGYASSVVRCVGYFPASGKAVVANAFSDLTSKPTTLSGYGITDALPSSYLDTDGTLSANSDTKIASQKAVKTYADALIAANDAMVFKGVQDCSANPNYPAANRGDTYRVSVAGKIGGASGVNVEAGDMLICITDSTASGNQATVGAQWAIVQTNIDGAYFAGGTDVAVADGGTGSSTAAGALTNLGALAKAGDTLTGALNWATPVTIASASTVNIGAAASNYVAVTGTTTITAFDTIAAGAIRILQFSGAITLTHNSTSLILPGAANIATAAGDCAWFKSEGSGNWRCINYRRAAGRNLNTGVSDTVAVGYKFSVYDNGTVSSGTLTPDPANGNYQKSGNNGAHTLAAPASDCAITLQITNGASAGAITLSGFTNGSNTGDALDTTNGHKFRIYIERIDGVSSYSIKALQ